MLLAAVWKMAESMTYNKETSKEVIKVELASGKEVWKMTTQIDLRGESTLLSYRFHCGSKDLRRVNADISSLGP